MKNTAGIFCFCLLLSALKADGQVKDVQGYSVPDKYSNDSIMPWHSRQPHIDPTDTNWNKQDKRNHKHSKNVDTIIHMTMKDGGCPDAHYPLIIEGPGTFNREEFKEYGILSFPNIWH
jgi:hypothetical protein